LTATATEASLKHSTTSAGQWLAVLGVVYGDIGTSPLYVYSSTFTANPSYDDLLGALSLIIWTLTLMVSVKYIFIVLRADDEGEGGTFALFTLLSRHVSSPFRTFSVLQSERSNKYAGQYCTKGSS